VASAPDYGSTFGALVFVQELALLAYFAVRAIRDANVAAHDGALEIEVASAQDRPDDDDDGRLSDDVRFLFDVVARQNEGIIQNIDALDNGLIAVAVGVIAIALFASDKWFDLDPNLRFAGFFFLSESAVVALFGYLTTYFMRDGTIDAVLLGEFVVDFSDSPVETTSLAISDISRSGKSNVVARRYKRAFMILTTLLAVVAAGVIVAARALGHSANH
jgi:hypothetical protein